MLNSDQISQRAPLGAGYFRLVMQHSDGAVRVYPAADGSYFRLGETPDGVPVGSYSVLYYDKSLMALLHAETSVYIAAIAQNSHPWQRTLSLNPASNAQIVSSDTPAAQAQTALQAEPQRARSLSPQEETDPELRRHLMAMDLEDRQQEFIKSASYVQEVGETFAMNRILRRELIKMQRIVVQSTQQSYKDVEQLKGAMHTLLQLQKEIVASAAQIPRPAPPPPDYAGLGRCRTAWVVCARTTSSDRSAHRPLPSTGSTL